jgi:hypothetical protein
MMMLFTIQVPSMGVAAEPRNVMQAPRQEGRWNKSRAYAAVTGARQGWRISSGRQFEIITHRAKRTDQSLAPALRLLYADSVQK